MKNSAIYQLLSAFSPAESKNLLLWLESPVHNRREAPLFLGQYLLQCLKNKQNPEESAAWAFIISKQPGDALKERRGRPAKPQPRSERPSDQQNAVQLRLLMSELLRLTEDFMVYQHRQLHEVRQAIDLLACYREKGLDKPFEKNIHQARQVNQRQPYRHTTFWDAQADIAFEWYQYAGNKRKTEQLHLEELAQQSDMAYAARKLREACLAITYQTVYKNTMDQGLLPALLTYLEQSPRLLEVPAIALYFYCYQLFTHEQSFAWFERFKTLLLEQQHLLPPDEQRTLHLLGINYCILKINQTHREYCQEALDLYQSGLKSGILIENGVISHMAFNNIVSIALKVNATQWAHDFIRQYDIYLEKRHQSATVCMNLARIYHIQKNYAAALRELAQFDSRDQANNLLARSLQIKIYYETEDLDALELHLQSMQLFIRRQRVIGYHKTNYLNIIRYTKKLMLHNPNDKAARQALRESIQAETHLTEKEWLLDKLA